MLFNSFHYLMFFPVVVAVFYLFPKKSRKTPTMQWIWLLICSYYFYMSWNAVYAILMAFSTLVTYASGLLIGRANHLEDERTKLRLKRLWVVLCIGINLSILFFFKYYNFVAANLNGLLSALGIGEAVPAHSYLLPVGISFYTFQALGYSIDVYRGEIPAEKNLGKYAVFVSFFPQLVAGPIERSKNLLGQFNEKHTFDYDRIKSGLVLMLWGYFQKMVIADRAAGVVDIVYNNYTSSNGVQIIVATVLFAVQIYCDFAGYSNIAIGSARILGFRLMDNFKQPYFALSIQDFWRRWHVSLSTWFRDYVYIPLGGNRGSKLKKYRNLFITFLVSGLWHGASWNYAIWGGLHGAYQIVGSTLRPHKEKLFAGWTTPIKARILKWVKIVVTFVLVDFAWIFFRAPGGLDALNIIQRMVVTFNPHDLLKRSSYLIGIDLFNALVLIIAIIVLFAVDYFSPRYDLQQRLFSLRAGGRWVVYYASVLAVLLFGIIFSSSTQAQFIYFQF